MLYGNAKSPSTLLFCVCVCTFLMLLIFSLQIVFCVGVVLNEGCNFLLKHLIKEPRPDTSKAYTTPTA